MPPISKGDLVAIVEKLSLPGVASCFPQGACGDGDLNLSLFYDGKPVGVSGVAYGLEHYYEWTTIDQYHEEEIRKAIDAAKDSWVIVQMQGLRGTAKQREGRNFRRDLLRAWDAVFEAANERLLFYLPASINYWSLSVVEQDLYASHLPLPDQECLLMNYDYTAKRNGFWFDERSCLFRRE
jgi:hypothetical protein